LSENTSEITILRKKFDNTLELKNMNRILKIKKAIKIVIR